MMKDLVLGIGDKKHVDDPKLWNLLVITSKLPYLWEDKKVKPGNRPAEFVTVNEARKDLNKYIGGELIGDMVSHLNPLEFLEIVRGNSIAHLDVCKFFGDEGGLKSIITARVYTWCLANGVPVPANARGIINMISRIEK
jgi:hypothetical protein